MKTCSSRRPAAAAWSAACFARFLAKPEAPEFPSLVLAGTATTVSADTHRRLYQHVMCANTTPHMPCTPPSSCHSKCNAGRCSLRMGSWRRYQASLPANGPETQIHQLLHGSEQGEVRRSAVSCAQMCAAVAARYLPAQGSS